MCKEISEPKILVPWDQILNFLALRHNAGPTQAHAGYRCTPYDFLVRVEHVFFEDIFFLFQSFLHRCGLGFMVVVIPLMLSEMAMYVSIFMFLIKHDKMMRLVFSDKTIKK